VDPVALWILRVGLAALLATAAFHKASQPRAFAETLRDYRVLPDAFAPAAVAGIVALEAGVAIALLLPGTSGRAALACGALLAAYSAAIALNLARGRRTLDCGCLGPRARQPISGWLLARNGGLVLASALAALPAEARSLHWVDAVSIAGGAAVLALLFHATNALAAQAAAGRFGRPG
jgi:hypothetical protein